jgi:cytidylate kinase
VATLLTERDRLDSTRTTSPLYAAPDAVVVDTTGKPIGAVVEEVLSVIERNSIPSPELRAPSPE